LALSNVVGVDDLGPHKYDNGALSLEGSRPGALPFNDEHNGLVYTCRGGFIDTAHLRDWADWTLYLGAQIARTLETGTTITLESEGAQRRIITRPIDPNVLARHDRRDIAVPLAQWLAFQLSTWHEIATWYGWSTIPLFPEEASAFSPEDLYSNLLGSKVAGILVYEFAVTSEAAYNENMNAAVRRVLQRLGAVRSKLGIEALRAVDGVWWNSKVALPAKNLLLRRNFQIGTELTPWLVAQAPLSNPPKLAVAEACAGEVKPIVLRNPDTCASDLVRFDTVATFELEVEESIAARFPFPRPGSRHITQADFPAIVAQIRAENAVEFGANADRPD
ncbi:MAG TPA: DUF4056 domain-containing protein, partial [Candidatus Kryptonia bacterium]|nr:DUF4056 domain-containing protein [Candidatus Kryptonia bacterium]